MLWYTVIEDLNPHKHSQNSPENSTDRQWVEEVLSGRCESFRSIVLRYEKRLRHFCRVRLPSDEVEDLMQDIFLKTYRNLHSFHSDGCFATWFFTIAFHTVASKKLKFKRELEKLGRMMIFFKDKTGINEGERNLEAEALRKAVSKLSQGNREVVELFYFAELEIPQICKVLSLSSSTVKTRLFRARKDLRIFLDPGNLA